MPNIRACCFVQIEDNAFKNFISCCRLKSGIHECFRLTGQYDAMIEINVPNIELLYDIVQFVMQLPGMQSINTHLIAQEWTL